MMRRIAIFVAITLILLGPVFVFAFESVWWILPTVASAFVALVWSAWIVAGALNEIIGGRRK